MVEDGGDSDDLSFKRAAECELTVISRNGNLKQVKWPDQVCLSVKFIFNHFNPFKSKKRIQGKGRYLYVTCISIFF